MKKLIALALALALALTVSSCFAMTLEPDDVELEKLAGTTFHATVGAYNPEDKTFTVQVYDCDRYDDDDVARLSVGDIILAGGFLHTVTGEKDVDGTHIFECEGGDEIFFRKAEDDDDMIAVSTFDDRVYMNVVTVLHVPAAEGIVYEDNSNPDLDAQPVEHKGLEAVLAAKEDAETNSNGFDFYATTVTLDRNLEIVKIHRDFDVAQ